MVMTSSLLVIVCAACSADQEGAPSHPVQSPGTISTAEGLSAMSASPALESPPAEAGTPPDSTGSPEKRACRTDQDCAPDFCDRGVCATPGKGLYGRDECEPDPPQPKGPEPPLPPNVKRAPKAGFPEPECGAYRCIDGRCRSCQSDAECGEGLACKSWEGFPGTACGRPGPEVHHVPQQPPPMPPMLGEGAEHPPDPSGRQIPQNPSQFQPPPPPPKPSK
jgi:hypothetical protein